MVGMQLSDSASYMVFKRGDGVGMLLRLEVDREAVVGSGYFMHERL